MHFVHFVDETLAELSAAIVAKRAVYAVETLSRSAYTVGPGQALWASQIGTGKTLLKLTNEFSLGGLGKRNDYRLLTGVKPADAENTGLASGPSAALKPPEMSGYASTKRALSPDQLAEIGRTRYFES